MAAHAMMEKRGSTQRHWFLSLGLTIVGGLAWVVLGFGLKEGGIAAILSVILPALTCLVAGWLLRSWSGLVAAAVAYVAVSALMWVLAAVADGPGGMAFLSGKFALYVVLPGVALSIIGTAIGMYRPERAA